MIRKQKKKKTWNQHVRVNKYNYIFVDESRYCWIKDFQFEIYTFIFGNLENTYIKLLKHYWNYVDNKYIYKKEKMKKHLKKKRLMFFKYVFKN
jgi:hypothetical protein